MEFKGINFTCEALYSQQLIIKFEFFIQLTVYEQQRHHNDTSNSLVYIIYD